MNDKLLKPYNQAETEDRIYKIWEDSGFFNPDNLPGERNDTFTVVLPPPNVTGTLHIGHTYEDTLQDIAIRYQRMRGKKTLWIPGTDSAAIATQARVEKNIQKEEDKSRHDLGREELVRRVNEFASSSEKNILNQIRKVGASLDWSRYAYTLDEKRNKAVKTAFVKMYEAGLIYRGNRIVNWDPKGQTTISDDEIVYETRKATLYTFKYSKDFPISISTTRPETKVGDVAVAVHPDDERYKKFVGKEYDLVFAGEPIHVKIIADQAVDKEFGTGALGVTPAHSLIDADIAERHGLPMKQVINEFAKMSVPSMELNGKKVADARKTVVEWLQKEGLLEKEEEIEQNVATAERTGGIIEPLPKLQWWIAVNKSFRIPHSEIKGIKSGSDTTLKETMRMSVENGDIEMSQENFRKTYFNWINNLHDWCISRQIWFGHRIPVWFRENEIYCGIEAPNGNGWKQEEDVLDTWFSAALWTFSTLGWPEKTKDLENFYPTSFMSPAYEILPLWVSRMIMMSGFHLGKVPFRKVLIHGLVRDKQGRKFSKSLNNGIDPLDIIAKYGADALRMGLSAGTAIGNDVSFDENKIKGYKNFANKIWNASRFVLSSVEGVSLGEKPKLTDTDSEAISFFHETLKDATADMENYRFYLAGEKLYHYFWHTFADIILEGSKDALNNGDERQKISAQWTLLHILTESLKALHPFMPFVTEEIWSMLPHYAEASRGKPKLLMIEAWPLK